MSSPIIKLPQVPKDLDPELRDYLLNINKILIGKQNEDYGENETIKAQIATLKPSIYCTGTMEDTTSNWHGSKWLDWIIGENSGGWSNKGIPGRVYPPKTGKYYVVVQQLIQLNGGVLYYRLEKNEGLLLHACTNSTYHTDMHVSTIVHMTTNDYFDLKVAPSATMKAWGGAHSRFSIIYIGE